MVRSTPQSFQIQVDGWTANIYALEIWAKGVRVLGYSDTRPQEVVAAVTAVRADFSDDAVFSHEYDPRLGQHAVSWTIAGPTSGADLNPSIIDVPGGLVLRL